MGDVLTEARFWAQVIGDSRRTVVCSPENESRCKGWVDARGLAGLIKVVASPLVDDRMLMVIDEQALDAQLEEWRRGYPLLSMPQPPQLLGYRPVRITDP